MKRIYFFTMFFLTLGVLNACSTNEDVFPYPELLTDQEGTYSILAVDNMVTVGVGSMTDPALQEVVGLSHNLPSSTTPNSTFLLHIIELEDAQQRFGDLYIEKAPAIMVFNNKEMVLKTYNMNEAKDFFVENSK